MLRGLGWLLVVLGVCCWMAAGATQWMLRGDLAPRKTWLDWAAGQWEYDTYTAKGQRRLDVLWRLFLVGAVLACSGFIVVNFVR